MAVSYGTGPSINLCPSECDEGQAEYPKTSSVALTPLFKQLNQVLWAVIIRSAVTVLEG